MKIVINGCYGGYGLSPEAALWLDSKGFTDEGFKIPVDEYFNPDRSEDHLFSKKSALARWNDYKTKKGSSTFVTVFTDDEKFVLSTRPENRTAPLLIQCVEELKEKANGNCAKLKIVEIPDGTEYEIDEYDGIETVDEKHRSWS